MTNGSVTVTVFVQWIFVQHFVVETLYCELCIFCFSCLGKVSVQETFVLHAYCGLPGLDVGAVSTRGGVLTVASLSTVYLVNPAQLQSIPFHRIDRWSPPFATAAVTHYSSASALPLYSVEFSRVTLGLRSIAGRLLTHTERFCEQGSYNRQVHV